MDTDKPLESQRGEWANAERSAAWTFTLKPWLEEQYHTAMDRLVAAASIDDMRFLQGKAQAFKEMLEAPADFARLETQLTENERQAGIGEEHETEQFTTGTNGFWQRFKRR